MIRPLSFRRLTPEHAAALLLALTPLLYFLPAVRGRLVLCPDDGLIFNLPLRAAAAQMVREGFLPLWNPYIFGGMPLFASAQGGLLLPLNWLFLFLSAPLAMNLSVLSTYALAGVGAYLFARRTGASLWGALLTGLVWQWSGFLVAQIGHTNIIQTAALLPWLLWSIELYAATRRRAHGLLVALFVALSVFAGHQQTLLYALLLAAAYAAHMAAAEGRDVRRAYLGSLLLLASGVLLSAVQILPTLELARNSLRAGASYDFFSSFSMPPVFVLTFLAPYVVGGGDGSLFRAPYTGEDFYAEYIGYVSLAALALAALAPLLRRDARTKFWAVAALVCLALAFGRFWPFDLYRLIYYVPLLNLFRVPARHLLEVDFALAVLAGRALTTLEAKRRTGQAHELAEQTTERPRRTLFVVAAVAASLFVLTCLTVTVWRPSGFQLGRVAPVTLLRAPELFLPVVLAALSAWALWRVARGYRRACALLIVVVALDLCLWGQTSGWRTRSPSREHPLWQTPPAVEWLRRQATRGQKFRILTTPAPFVADAPPGLPAAREAHGKFVMAAQPDFYMLHAVENAAGYDGFGLSRYSRLAGEMKLWGELTDPEQSLRGESRAFDLLDVRYLLSPSAAEGTEQRELPRATVKLGAYLFAEQELGLPYVNGGAHVAFDVPGVEATRIALVTNMSWSAELSDGTPVARVRLWTEEGRKLEFDLRAGNDTAEWAHEREAAHNNIRHRRAPVATSNKVEDPAGDFEAHAYLASFKLPSKAVITGGEIEVAQLAQTPKLGLSVQRISLIDETSGATVPVAKQWLTQAKERTGQEAPPSSLPQLAGAQRWRRVAQAGDMLIYENLRALPRAWLATETRVAAEEAALEVVRTGKLPDGSAWEPQRTALVEASLPLSEKGAGDSEKGAGDAAGGHVETRAEITRYEPNRIDLRTDCAQAAVLVLAENHYPGWRASVDGRAVETLRVDYNLRGVLLPPGAHEVRLGYRPKSALAGLLVSLLTVLALGAWWARWPEEKARRALSRFFARREAG